jgi:hypothetical protein
MTKEDRSANGYQSFACTSQFIGYCASKGREIKVGLLRDIQNSATREPSIVPDGLGVEQPSGIQRDHWSGAELRTALAKFEADLRDAGLRENVILAQVAGCETFLQWLMDDCTLRSDVPPTPRASEAEASAMGPAILEELSTLGRAEIAGILHDYAAVADYDKSLGDLLTVTEGPVDLMKEDHRDALLKWLRAWRCRHLRSADNARTGSALEQWWEAWGTTLPQPGALITSLSDDQLLSVEKAFDALATMSAAGRMSRGGEIDVRFGDVAASKALFAVRPEAFLPWDNPIRLAFGWRTGTGATYVMFLRSVAATLDSLASRLGAEVSELPRLLGRPESSAAKVVDEYLWTRITRRL